MRNTKKENKVRVEQAGDILTRWNGMADATFLVFGIRDNDVLFIKSLLADIRDGKIR
jgi:hypothetical protein